MKTIRGLTTLTGLFVAVLALGALVARGDVIDSPRFAGTFTLPVQAQWGKMTLPAGDYTLRFGLLSTGHPLVEVQGRAERSFHGVVLVGQYDQTSATKNAILCVRDGNTLVVRALEMPAIGGSATFMLPRGMKLTAQKGNHNGYTQLAEAPMHMERIPVTLSAK